jgi:two-component system NtrC family response regulator
MQNCLPNVRCGAVFINFTALLYPALMKKVLIIDDEVKLRELLARIIGLEGYEVLEAGDCKSGLKRLEQAEIDVVLCDVKLPDGNGVELAQQIKAKYPMLEVILLTAYGNIPDSVQAMKNGAFDYLTKGDDNNRIIPLLSRAMEKVELAKQVQQLQRQLGKRYAFESIVGKSKSLQAAIELAKKVAPTETTVLLTGETGTGKEVFAQAIHHASKRAAKPFLAINCGAFSASLLASELFGYKAGAFTGATKDHKGLLEEAHHGTFFLDEIGEMPTELQVKLLRVLESGELLRVGDTKPIQVNVRIIAATNRDLAKEIEGGRFRSDLFYRLSVFQIHIPALRERLEDMDLLCNHFAKTFGLKMAKRIHSCTAQYVAALKQHSFPGNIRELKNIIERSTILEDGEILSVESLPLELQVRSEGPQSTEMSTFSLASAERMQIQKVLQHTQGNKTEAARLLQIALTTLYRKLEEYKIV